MSLDTSDGDRPGLTASELVGLAFVAAAALGYEVFLTRLLAYTVPTLLIYLVLGVAMTGFGAASSMLTLRPVHKQPSHVMSLWAGAFSLGILASTACFVRIAPMLASSPFLALLAALLLTLPFFAAGTVITLALSTAGSSIRRAYAVDLFGSGVGCALPFVAMRALDGTGLAGLFALLAAIASFLFHSTPDRDARPRPSVVLPAVAVVASVGAIVFRAALLPITPEPLGQVAVIEQDARSRGYSVEKTYDRWNVTGRARPRRCAACESTTRTARPPRRPRR